ncbi:hypothetical protein COLO4_28366 [Corchorus olitorius]|uniref:Uncharacterized protein n=1 Tax=Corchorus olitorius TaxID=93759 RepID=A0A1R3HLK8_9ROSI|nr:hypothetical protein COLO4_28366 [Corchorus olitorius]
MNEEQEDLNDLEQTQGICLFDLLRNLWPNEIRREKR